MARGNNYLIQASQAKSLFLAYDQEALIRKFHLKHDETFLYIPFLGRTYRIQRSSGDMEYLEGTCWLDGNSFEEVLTLLDLLCDSGEDRSISGEWKTMESFGQMFHRSLLNDQIDPVAEQFDADPEGLDSACRAMGGISFPQGDIAYAIELFDGLRIGLQFWHADEDFPAQLKYFWDANALQYIRYETMYYAVGLLKSRLIELMNRKNTR